MHDAYRHPYRALGVFGLLALTVCGLSLVVGTGSLADLELRTVFLELRVLRTLVAFAVGASLAVAGVMVQAAFANPLASPSILGVSAGASLGGQLALVAGAALAGTTGLGFVSAETLVPAGALAGGLLALALLLAVLRYQNDQLAVILTGFLLSSLFLSIGSFVLTIAMDSWSLGRSIVTYSLGSVSGSGVRQASIAWIFLAVGSTAAIFWGRSMTMLHTGDDEAASLGLDVRRTRRWVLVWAAVLSAGATAVAGTVAFAGLIVPHLVRRYTGERFPALLVGSIIAGGAFIVMCDTIARAVPATGEIPLGVVSGLVGAPVFLVIFTRWNRTR